jgi:DNA-directed RNA polymerase sigma subunit (sigma70/sigma32)
VYKEDQADSSCALDLADDDGHFEEKEIADLLGLTPEEVKQTLESAFRKLRHFSKVDLIRFLYTQTTED